MIWCVIALFVIGVAVACWSIYLNDQRLYWKTAAELENGKVRRHADTIKRLAEELENHKRKLGLDALKAQYGIEALRAVAMAAHEHIQKIHDRFDPQPSEDPDE
jgi:hypothetical protein